MSRFVRITSLLSRLAFRSRIGVMDESVLRLRVGLGEADWKNVHQAVYPLYCELGRWDLAVRIGMTKLMWKERCAGIVAAQALRYFRPLRRFEAFDVRTRIVGWDGKWIYFEQRLERNGLLCVLCHVKAIFIGRGGKRFVPAELSVRAGGPDISPPLGESLELLAAYGEPSGAVREDMPGVPR